MNRYTVYDTRPADASLASALQALGHAVQAVPVFTFTAHDQHAALRRAAQQAEQGTYAALLYVSRTAMQFFYQICAPAYLPETLEHWCLGPGSAASLRSLFEARNHPAPHHIVLPPHAPWDSEHLLTTLKAKGPLPATVLHVRGADAEGQGQGRQWMPMQLRQAGVQVDEVLAYKRHLQPQPAQPGIWLISSSLALEALTPQHPAWQQSVAICVHTRIAERAKEWGFAHSLIAAPTVQAHSIAVTQALEWLKSRHV